MEIIHLSVQSEEDKLTIGPGAQVVAVGDFDGFHKGHQEVLRRAAQTAGKLSLPVSVMTFHPHPREVLGQPQYALSLTPLEDKLEHFAKLGLKRAYVIRFDRNFAGMEPEQFVERVLMPLHVQTAVVGFDFTFGHRGAGTVDTLSSLAKGRFAVEVVRPFHEDGEKISSTLIRERLAEGDVDNAGKLLGRPYSIRGLVVTGEGRGRTIGVPTANVEPSEAYVIPARGVYAVRFTVEGEVFGGVMNIGLKPTFSSDGLHQTLEAHLFDFNRSIYGCEVEVAFVGFIRPERKFGSAAELVEQIRSDMVKGKEMLK